MSNVRIHLNKAGVRELLKSEAMRAAVREKAAQIQRRAGDEYIVEDRTYPERVGAAVRPATKKAYHDNMENNTLLKAVR